MVTREFERRLTGARGFSFIDMIATIAVITTVAAIAVPALTNAVENQRLGIEARNVERELQLARLNAVSTNRPIRVRFDCPTTGFYRRVELIGSANAPLTGDDDDSLGARRCNLANYPYPAADRDPLTRPNDDGPLMRLNSTVSFSASQTLEFWPDGTVHVMTGASPTAPLPQMGAVPATISLTRNGQTKSITVNSLGKIQIQ